MVINNMLIFFFYINIKANDLSIKALYEYLYEGCEFIQKKHLIILL